MSLIDLTFGDWFALVQHELFLFAAVFFLVGALDEFAVDITYLWLRLTGRAGSRRIDEAQVSGAPMLGMAAVFIPAWREARVIGETIAHALAVWPQDELRLYVGCYRNDLATLEAAMKAAGGDPRLRLVVHDRDGPTSKADCLNRLYRALREDERRSGEEARMVVLHDAEDMVDPLALPVMDRALDDAEFVQLPVIALPQCASTWIAGHYSDEFAEAHGKAMVVRHTLGAGIPGAGVGCAIAREMLGCIEFERGRDGPFPTGSLTEDYELGLQVKALGGRDCFLRFRAADGRLIGTRSYFPATPDEAIRQKARWIEGIALRGWDRLGWSGRPVELWMQLRDRRGPFAALLLAAAYLLVLVTGLGWLATEFGLIEPRPLSPLSQFLLTANLVALGWRLAFRFAFTTREFGLVQGLISIPRVFVSNFVAIIAGRRAVFGYVRSLRGAPTYWDKTDHRSHPAVTARAAAMEEEEALA